MADALAERREQRERLLTAARTYVERLQERLPVAAAVMAGSVARGDFNVWSDVDVVVVAEPLPERAVDRAGLLLDGVPARVQPIGFTPDELHDAWRRGNRLVRDAVEACVVPGGDAFATLARAGRP